MLAPGSARLQAQWLCQVLAGPRAGPVLHLAAIVVRLADGTHWPIPRCTYNFQPKVYKAPVQATRARTCRPPRFGYVSFLARVLFLPPQRPFKQWTAHAHSPWQLDMRTSQGDRARVHRAFVRLLRRSPCCLAAAVSTMPHMTQPTASDAGSRLPITLAGWTIEGVSVAGQVLCCLLYKELPPITIPHNALMSAPQETCLLLPQLKVAFDIGRCPNRSISHQHVFISHGHMDHIGGIPFHAATRCLMQQKPTRLYSLQQVCTAAQALVDVHSALEREPIPIHVQTIGVRSTWCSVVATL